jgi:transcriptional regulator with XRE-family HTH domain
MGADPTDAYKADVTNYLKVLGKNVRTLREGVSPRLSQERLAEITGLHRTEIGKIEQGQVDPRLMTLHLVAHALDATLGDLAKGLPVPPQRDLWGHYKRGNVIPTVDSGPQTDRRQSREVRAKGNT